MSAAAVAIPPLYELPPLPRKGEVCRVLRGETMGTSWSARFFAPPERAESGYREAIERELDRVVTQMSHWLPDSDLSRFSRDASGNWHSLQPEFAYVLDFALRLAEETSGAYDPAIGRIVDEWGFGPTRKPRQHPDSDVLKAVRQQCGWQLVEFDREHKRARHTGNIGLDLSSIAKGFAVDQAGHALVSSGVSSYLIEIGGELRASGVKPGGQPWWVAVEQSSAFTPEIRIALSGWSIATSGGYRRCFQSGNETWTHTIDGRTGVALDQNIVSVSVIHRECMAADAYSTALMVLGVKEGLGFAEEHDLAAVFTGVSDDGVAMHCTRQFQQMLDPT